MAFSEGQRRRHNKGIIRGKLIPETGRLFNYFGKDWQPKDLLPSIGDNPYVEIHQVLVYQALVHLNFSSSGPQQRFQIIVVRIIERDVDFAIGRFGAGAVQEYKSFGFAGRSAVVISKAFHYFIGDPSEIFSLPAIPA